MLFELYVNCWVEIDNVMVIGYVVNVWVGVVLFYVVIDGVGNCNGFVGCFGLDGEVFGEGVFVYGWCVCVDGYFFFYVGVYCINVD